MKYSNKLAEYIRYRRTEAGYSLNKFAIEAEMESSTLSRNETKINEISIDNLVKISSVYKQTPAEFLKDFEDYAKANS